MAAARKCNLIAVCQLMCNSDKAKNLLESKALITKAAQLGAKVIFLPEVSDYVEETAQQGFDLAEPVDGPTVKSFKELAASLGVWLSLGVHIKTEESAKSGRVFNRHLLIDSNGDIVEYYNKLHLFDIYGESPFVESNRSVPGKKIVPPVSSPVGNIGLALLNLPEPRKIGGTNP